jgi:hypothetical protein
MKVVISQSGAGHGVQDPRQEVVKPHKVRYYLEQRDPDFAEKMAEVLCVYRCSGKSSNNCSSAIASPCFALNASESQHSGRGKCSLPKDSHALRSRA